MKAVSKHTLHKALRQPSNTSCMCFRDNDDHARRLRMLSLRQFAPQGARLRQRLSGLHGAVRREVSEATWDGGPRARRASNLVIACPLTMTSAMRRAARKQQKSSLRSIDFAWRVETRLACQVSNVLQLSNLPCFSLRLPGPSLADTHTFILRFNDRC
jgi:hypothetical protein